MAPPERYQSGAAVVVSAQFRCISDDPLGVGSDRGLVVALELVVSAPFRFVSDDALGVGGWSRRSRPCRAAKTSSFGTISMRRACRNAKSDDPYSGRGVSWRQHCWPTLV